MLRKLTFSLVATLALITPAVASVDIKPVTSASGLTAWLVEEPSIPFVALELRFQGGTSLDLPGKAGATNLMMGLLEEGTGDLDARGFAREVEGLAASFDYGAYDDTVTVSARFLSENKDEALALLRGSLVEPRFDTDAVERVREQVLSGIRSDLKSPQDIAGREMDRLLFGDHPYSLPQSGTLETVTALSRDDILTAHKNALTRDRVFISAVGDVTAPELAQLLDELLVDLPLAEVPLPPRADVNLPGGTRVVEFETPQSVALFAQGSLHRDDPDFFAAFVLDHILGGGSFESRLMQEVREKRGLTYGVSTFLVDKDQAKLWMGSVASANDRVGEAIEVIRAEWAKAANEGITEEELRNAQTYLTGAYPLRFDSNASIANIIVAMQMDGLPLDYIDTRNNRVNAVTLEDVNRVAKRVLAPDMLTFVVVGQPDGV
ncbi:pitrilysin family protein [Thalassobius sp. Cn5-15]|uniref:M16 family metallopeptidase n=1 Tax=Thalassobius sp. Cn5-15 TaxID=2917763 RepID=UPI001EF2EE01|nr:pitrilysin family protein [Thalassobius sp. Cn5-15]MCG7494905.1 insulinase family protein [Thalassobius sp. Cn5-15]